MNRFSALLLTACLALGGVTAASPARTQDDENALIAAAKKAALIIEEKGTSTVAPTIFAVKVEAQSDAKGRSVAQAELDRQFALLRGVVEKEGFHPIQVTPPQVLLRNSETSFSTLNTLEAQDPPGAAFRVTRSLFFEGETPEKVRAVFSALRASGGTGYFTVSYSVRGEQAARRAALKNAIAQAKERVAVFAEAAKPKVFELVFAKEGEFQMPSPTTGAAIQGTEPLQLLTQIEAEATVTLFYGFAATAPAAKPAKKA